MENGVTWDPSLLIRELEKGQNLTRQLETQLDQSPPEFCKSLLQSIQSALHRATSLAKSLTDYEGGDSPRSVSGSDDSHRAAAFRDQDPREISKKRKMLPRWKKQVRANPGTSLEGPPEDGFSWRKYGQKDILGAAHPRGYYRCTHRNTQGCPATKQVQRADGDPSVFNVLYKGEHVCAQRANSSPAPAPTPEQGQSFILDGRPGLRVITQDLLQGSPPSFSSSPSPASHIFPSPATRFSSPLLSPSTAAEAHFTAAGFAGGRHRRALESDLAEVLLVSATSSPAMDLEFLVDVDFDGSFFI